jgi:hypothetical protein
MRILEELLFETILPYGRISCNMLLIGAGGWV